MILPLNEIKEHLRYDSDDTSNDLVLTGYILAAEATIKNFIRPDVDINSKPDLKVAAMLLVGFFDLYRNAEATVSSNPSVLATYMPYPVLYLLTPYRRPVAF